MIRAHMVLLLSLVAGCTETIRFPDPLENLVGLELAPGDQTITLVDLQVPADQHHRLQYTATGVFADGSRRDVTGLVHWSIDNTLLGAIDKGELVASHTAAGHGIVSAFARDQQATANLTILIDAALTDAAFPPPQGGLFDPQNAVIGGDPTRSPALVYPAEGTLMPQGISRTLFQYLRGSGNDAYQLRFESDVLKLYVETGADRWEADNELMLVLAGSGLAGPIRVEVRATSSTGPNVVYAGNHITLGFTHDQPLGPLYFWSASTSGIMRGGIDIHTASKLYPGSTTCVGCHAITRDASAMAMGYDMSTTVALQTIDLTTLTTRIDASTTRPMGWGTYSPDGSRLLVANNGALTLYDAASGNTLGAVPLPAMRYATHPDWSPDGSYVAVALTSQSPTNRDVRSASIARIPYNGGVWGTPEVLVVGSSTNNNYFPKYSPDGKRLLFVHATATSQGATSAELMLMPAGGGTPTLLRVASHRVGTTDDVPDLSDTMPTWSSAVGDRAWIAFVSARAYGAIRPTTGSGQVWITSVDPGGFADSAAFWLPCQDITVLNYNPVWSDPPVTTD